MADNLPYVTAYGNVSKVLQKIKAAATPPRFTQDFLETKLAMKGGSARPVIPYLKRTGFLASDGVPTDIYKRFRNPQEGGTAAAEALRKGYSALFEINETVHELKDAELKGVVVQATGLEPSSGTVKSIVGSFKALKAVAASDYEDTPTDEKPDVDEDEDIKKDAVVSKEKKDQHPSKLSGFGLSYTINLNLPAVSDVAVFDAIFRSLKEHLLK